MTIGNLTIDDKTAQKACLGLYGVFGIMALRKKPLPLVALMGTHLAEYFLKARLLADENAIDRPKAFVMCLLYGITWWKPIEGK